MHFCSPFTMCISSYLSPGKYPECPRERRGPVIHTDRNLHRILFFVCFKRGCFGGFRGIATPRSPSISEVTLGERGSPAGGGAPLAQLLRCGKPPNAGAQSSIPLSSQILLKGVFFYIGKETLMTESFLTSFMKM